MSRRSYVGLALALFLAAGAVLWGRMAGSGPSFPARQSIPRLADSVTIEWTAQNTARIEATSTTDGLAALGYVHGMTRSWVATVWRRTALGTLSRWFGPGLVPLDRHARQLGFGHHARRAYRQLPARAQNRLRAYTQGLNAALRSNRVSQQEAFVVLGKTPGQWAPWHPLAVERLLAWIGTSFLPLSGGPTDELQAFQTRDRLLRRWLHLHGWDRSVAWAAQSTTDSTRAALFTRYVLGASANPLIQEVSLHWPKRDPTVLSSLPGAPLFPTGTTGHRAWSYLLGSSARLDRVVWDSTQVHDRYERVAPRPGRERLVRVRRYDGGLLLPPTSPDSAWVLRWPGLGTHSDVPRWFAEADLGSTSDAGEQSTPPFHLLRGTGLVLDAEGDWAVRGRPPIVERTPNSVLVGRSPWVRYQAQSLRAHRARSPLAPARWSASDSSTWAARLLPRLLSRLASLSGTAPLLDDALAYLRNWNYTYAPSSIGAVLFEQWMRAHQASIGHVPTPSDPSYFATLRSRRAFQRAVDTLAARYGTDVRQWRWERIASDRRHFLGWSADSIVSADLRPLSTTRFSPLRRPGRGHSSALAGGPSLTTSAPLGPAPAQWEGWTRSGQPTLTVRRLRFDPSAFLARSWLRDDRPAPVSVTQGEESATTRLVPAQP
ncbi:MAG: penicillin acylase family protein [Salinibacter sp.]|uniref:penicillin acylase family protein n=1 Tax=Salinibacter sp. TaxID=2065818 RepID=UPI0035D443E2